MTETPPIIWVWVDYDGSWDGKWLSESKHIQPERLPDAEYICSDHVDTLIAEAVRAERDALIEEINYTPLLFAEVGALTPRKAAFNMREQIVDRIRARTEG